MALINKNSEGKDILCTNINKNDLLVEHSQKPRFRKQYFTSKWLNDPLFKDWLKEDASDHSKALCITCSVRLLAGKSELIKHSRSKKHKRNTLAGLKDVYFPNICSTDWLVSVENKELYLNFIFGEVLYPYKCLNAANIGFIGMEYTSFYILCGLLKAVENTIKECNIAIVSLNMESLVNFLKPCDMICVDSPLIIVIEDARPILSLENALREKFLNPRIVRAIANAPCCIGYGCSGEIAVVNNLFAAIGSVSEVDEANFNTIYAIISSGLVFIYIAIMALSDAGVLEGLPRKLAQTIVAHMVKGSAAMVLETGKHPGQLKDDVCLPRSATICGLQILESRAYRYSIMAAVETAAHPVEPE